MRWLYSLSAELAAPSGEWFLALHTQVQSVHAPTWVDTFQENHVVVVVEAGVQ